MIRRDWTSAEGQTCWLLLPQVEHARLAGALMKHWDWKLTGVALELRDEVLCAIDHHDDGWETWDSAPQTDRRTGQPLAFDEMPIPSSLAIWRQSIEAAEALGNLAPYMVASHFSALLARTTQPRSDDGSAPLLVAGFQSDSDQQRDTWLRDWQAEDPERHTRAAAHRAVAWLQFSDALSLWFCRSQRRKRHIARPPMGPPVTFSPVDAERIDVHPWPFGPDTVDLTAQGRAVPQDNYASAETLSTAPTTVVTLRWRLSPG